MNLGSLASGLSPTLTAVCYTLKSGNLGNVYLFSADIAAMLCACITHFITSF